MGNNNANEKKENRAGDSEIQVRQINISEDQIDPELFSHYAKKAAEECSRAGGDKNKRTQLRRFYDELDLWYGKVFSGSDSQVWDSKFEEARPYIQMLRAKVAYSYVRGRVDDVFKDMFDYIVQQINTKEHLKRAKLFMEAFLGYKRSLEDQEKR